MIEGEDSTQLKGGGASGDERRYVKKPPEPIFGHRHSGGRREVSDDKRRTKGRYHTLARVCPGRWEDRFGRG